MEVKIRKPQHKVNGKKLIKQIKRHLKGKSMIKNEGYKNGI